MPNDYSFEADVSRDQMAFQLANNPEQFVFTLSTALACLDLGEAIELGQLGDDAMGPLAVVFALRNIADAIEDGKIT